VSEQNPTQKGKSPISVTRKKGGEGEGQAMEIPVVHPICPYCGRLLPGMNILSMELPTPRGGMVWLLPSCPFGAKNEEGLAVDGTGAVIDGNPACGKILGAQWTGQYTPPKVAAPGTAGWI
jgi:hypothetical protein